MKTNKKVLLSIYTRSPLHIGCGTSVDIVDMPIIRERITNFPVIPGSSFKGVLRQCARDTFGAENNPTVNALFGNEDDLDPGDDEKKKKNKSYAGAVITGEGKLLAYPVRSLKGCFAWITCPAALHRLNRDWDISVPIPKVDIDHCIASPAISDGNTVVLEEYPLTVNAEIADLENITSKLLSLCDDTMWKAELKDKLVIVADENFQHYVTATTEIVARIQMDPKTRTNKNLFNQENVPCEALFYSVCSIEPPRRPKQQAEDSNGNLADQFKKLFQKNEGMLQIGGDETIGLGLCQVKLNEQEK